MISINVLMKSQSKLQLNYYRFVCTSKQLLNTFNDFKCLAINRKIEAKINIILNEFNFYKTSEEFKHLMPKQLSVYQMKQLLSCNDLQRRRRVWMDFSANRRRHLMFLWNQLESNDGRNQLTVPVMPYELEKLFENRLKVSSLFGQNIVFDLSFDRFMSSLECKNCAEQLNRIYRLNRYYSKQYPFEYPFCLNLCNVSKSDKTFQFIDLLFPELKADNSFVNIYSKSYLDLFAKQDLIYLSPHADQVLTEYPPNAVFIIGGIVDRKEVITLSTPKANEENIRSMRLPIDSLVNKTNIQSLDSVFKVLFDFKLFGVNNKSIGFEERLRKLLPNHKLKSVNQRAFENLKTYESEKCFDVNDDKTDDLKDSNCDVDYDQSSEDECNQRTNFRETKEL